MGTLQRATVRIWDSANGQCLRILRGHSQWVKSVAWSPDNLHIATGSYDEMVRIWQSDTGECTAVLYPLGPYAGMDITGTTGLAEAQRAALKTLGAVEATAEQTIGQAVTVGERSPRSGDTVFGSF